jgi:Ser/Thr protein kinase RdoA (MazF antagonist)
MEPHTEGWASEILEQYGIASNPVLVPLTSGLINNTWKVTSDSQYFILQRVNDSVFRQPHDLAENLRMLAQYLAENAPDYFFVSPVATKDQRQIVKTANGYYRLFLFVNGSHTISTVSRPEEAYEASRQFGKFTKLLAAFDTQRLRTTIPDFHNLELRYRQFEEAVEKGNSARIKQSGKLIDTIRNNRGIVDEYLRICESKNVRQRVTHHDTKISNVLFDQSNRGICVIDLDTVMPGYFISDMGDMFRTYLSPASEEEQEFSKIEIRHDFFKAIVQGYLSFMGDELSEEEQGLVLYSGKFLIYMQALRFLADYCRNDVYYGARYEQHNFDRAGNQLTLLAELMSAEKMLEEIVSRELRFGTYIFSANN